MIRRERRDGGEARGNEKREDSERGQREKREREKRELRSIFEEDEEEYHHLPLLVQFSQGTAVLL